MTLKRRLLGVLAAAALATVGVFAAAAPTDPAPPKRDGGTVVAVDPWPDGCGGCGNGHL
ncbi:hypothetical protein [Allorhizocola rhizosphaerae]|uniref:hypothetical protein n=1 Tax=Allorhizocola rhizosphaerae TaxID=1872709 RepID=UPI0013C31C77|nr:hypothetical protein [Allorhizocola rhizosphaerae]